MILVAGGTGTLGTRLVPRLVNRGLPVRIMTRDPARVPAEGAWKEGSVDVVQGDVRGQESVVRAMHGVDTVVSAVSGFAGPRGVSPASVDRDGNRHVVDAASAEGAAVVLVSIVGAARDHPMDLMRMKHAAEEHLRASGVMWTIIRSTAFLETWVGILEMTASRSGRPLVFGRGANPINFVSAGEVAALVERAVIDPSTRGRILEIGGPEDLSMNELAAAVQESAGRPGNPRRVPRPMLRAMAVLMRPMRAELSRQARAAVVMDTADMRFDASGIHEAFPDLPSTTVRDVLAEQWRVGRDPEAGSLHEPPRADTGPD